MGFLLTAGEDSSHHSHKPALFPWGGGCLGKPWCPWGSLGEGELQAPAGKVAFGE